MFEKTFCINLDTRPDRWEECLPEFEKLGLQVERFPGVVPFNKAQHDCLKKAVKYKSSLILEDDVEFQDISHLKLAISQLPKDWDLVSLGANIESDHKIKYSENLYRYENGWATQAVGYSKRMMEIIIKEFDPMCGLIYDEWLRVNILPKYNCYIVFPMVAFQRPSFSDLRNRFTDYTKVFENSKKHFK